MFAENIKQFQSEVDEILGISKHTQNTNNLSNNEYWNEISNETELLKLERSMERINKFSRRDIEGDLSQHDRREKRYIERAIKRKAGNISHKIYSESELQYFDYFETDEEFNNDTMDDVYTQEVIHQVIDGYQPLLTDRCSPFNRLEEYYNRRHFLTSNNAEREKRMADGIAQRKSSVEKNIIIGDIE